MSTGIRRELVTVAEEAWDGYEDAALSGLRDAPEKRRETPLRCPPGPLNIAAKGLAPEAQIQ